MPDSGRRSVKKPEQVAPVGVGFCRDPWQSLAVKPGSAGGPLEPWVNMEENVHVLNGLHFPIR